MEILAIQLMGPGAVAPAHLLDLFLSLFFTNFTRQQTKNAIDMSRMMAQLTMEAMTATLNPNVSYFDRAVKQEINYSCGFLMQEPFNH